MKKTIQVDSKNVFYRLEGNGKPVMLVHGFGETGEVWNQQVDHLKDQFQLIIPDLPGSGASDLKDDLSMENLAKTLLVILDAEKIEKVIMIGHSMGGYITLAFAENYGDRLQAFGLFSSTAFADSEEKIETRKKGIRFIREHGAFAFLQNTSPNLFSPITRDEQPELVDRFIAGLSNFSPQALVLYYEAMIQRPDRTNVLKNAPYPILFVFGKHDSAIPADDGLKLCHMAEKAYIHMLYRSGHLGMLEEVEESNVLLTKFLTEA